MRWRGRERPAPPEVVVAAYTRSVDDGLPPTDDAAAPRFPGSGSRGGTPSDPRREDSLTVRRKASGRGGRQPIDPLLGGSHPAAPRQGKQRLQPPVDPFGGEPLSILDDPSLDLPSAPRTQQARADAPRQAEDLDALLDRGPVTLPAIVPAAPPDTPDDDAGGPPTLPSLPPVAAAAPTPWAPSVRAQALAAANANTSALAGPRHARVRRVTRVVRHVDTWSVFKVALVFNLFLYVVTLTAGVLLWQVAQNTGTVDNIERFFENFGWERFELHGGEIFHQSWVAGLFLVVGFTGFAVLMATLFNLITDLVGGIRVSVLEEEVVARDDTSGSARPVSGAVRRWQQLFHRG